MPTTAILWFRRDLRVHDHPALHAAIAAADRIVPVFVVDDALLGGRWPSANRAWFMRESVVALSASLAQRGAALRVLRGRSADLLPALARETGATQVYLTRDATPYGRARDRAVTTRLAGDGVEVHANFRVFNPVLQGRRHDPDGAYVRRWVPELRGIAGAAVHEPGMLDASTRAEAGVRIGTDYPEPIVEHAEARERALAAYRATKAAARES